VKYSYLHGKSEDNTFIFSFRRMPTRFTAKDELNKLHGVNIRTIGRELREVCVLFSPTYFKTGNLEL